MIAAGTAIVLLGLVAWAIRRAISRGNLAQYEEDMTSAAYMRDNPTVAFHVRKGDGTTRNVSVTRN